MKKIFLILIISIVLIQLSYSQYKDIPAETRTKLKNGNMFLGFLNLKNLSLTHSFNISYVTFGGNSVSLTSYTGTISYKFLDNISLSADLTMQYSPFASLGSASSSINRDFQNSLSGIYLSRVSLDYKPAKNVYINLQYRNLKYNPYWFDNYYYSLWNDF
ncbi:MAG: hypothetical protein ACRDFC_02220 [Ignavibacteria bacterium]